MGREAAGYFIHGWQDINDQVRQMIFSDPRYQAIKSVKNGRALPSVTVQYESVRPGSSASLEQNNEQTIGKAAQKAGFARESTGQGSGA
jgi:hypothetical protein